MDIFCFFVAANATIHFLYIDISSICRVNLADEYQIYELVRFRSATEQNKE